MKTLQNFVPYKGVTLYTYEHIYPHDSWTEHEAVYEKDGRFVRQFVDFSHFQVFTEELFHMWVDLDMPDRTEIHTNGPIYPNDLIYAYHRKYHPEQ